MEEREPPDYGDYRVQCFPRRRSRAAAEGGGEQSLGDSLSLNARSFLLGFGVVG